MTQRTPGRTPGRAKRGEDVHVPYNADPKKVGTRSNVQMPTDVRRTADGFEDPADFFLSPSATEAGNGTFLSAFQTPTTRSGYETRTPMTGATGTSAGTMRRNRSRLSDLDRDEEDDDVADDLLLDDPDDLEMATPGQSKYATPGQSRYFRDQSHPSITLPSRSSMPADSPYLNISLDALPTPSRTSRSNARSPRKSSLTGQDRSSPSKSAQRRITSVTRAELEESRDDFDEADASGALGSSPASSTRSSQTSPMRNKRSPNQPQKNGRKSKGKRSVSAIQEDDVGDDSGLGFGDDSGINISGDLGDMTIETNGDDENEASEETRQKARQSTKSRNNVTRNSDRDEDDRSGSVSDNDNGPSFAYEEGEDPGGFDDSVQDTSFGAAETVFQTDRGGMSAMVDDIAGEDGNEDDAGDGSIGERARDRSESGEEDQDTIDEQPKKKARIRKPAPARAKQRAPPRARGVREGSVATKPRKTRVSQIGLGNDESEEEEEDGYHGNFKTRRSKRQHFKPLAWWRNEKFEYMPGPGLPVITEVVTYPQDEPVPLSQKARARSRSAAPKRKKEQSVELAVEEGWDDETDPTGIIIEFTTGEEVARKIAVPKGHWDKSKQGVGFMYQKCFGEGDFMAAGMIWIPIGSKKASKESKDNAYVFFVAQGAVQVTIHRTSFVMAPGGQFIVPRGNQYCIENISPDREVQLFFAQARKMRENEYDPEDLPVSKPKSGGSKAVSKGTAATGKGKRRLAVVEDDEGGSE